MMKTNGSAKTEGVQSPKGTLAPSRRNVRNIWILLLPAILIVGCEKEAAILEEEGTPLVRVVEIQPKTVYPTLEFTGSVVSQEIARIHAEVSGTVQEVFVRIGDRVTKGQPLVNLDPSDFRYRLQVARAERLKASAEYLRTMRGYRPEDIEATRNVYENAKALFRSKSRNLERNRALYDSGTMTERDWTVFLEELAAASAMVGKVSAEFSKMEGGYESYDLQSASATLLLASANEALAQRALTHTQIVSPIDGVISMRNVEIGQLVDPSQIILEVKDPNRVWLLADASAKEAGTVRVGQEADLYSDTLETTQKGRVDRISQTLDPNTRSLSIWFSWNDSDSLPPIGSFAKGTLHLDPIPDVFSLQRSWIHLEKGAHFIWIVEQGTLSRRDVAITQDRGGEVIIESGLETGTPVVVSPSTSFEEGLAVMIEPHTQLEEDVLDDSRVMSLSQSPSEGSVREN